MWGRCCIFAVMTRACTAALLALIAIGLLAPGFGLICGGASDIDPQNCCATSCPSRSGVDSAETCCERENAARQTTAPDSAGVMLLVAGIPPAFVPTLVGVPVPEPSVALAVVAVSDTPGRLPPKDLVKLKTSFLI
jgi:hypothetical protein